MSKVFVGRQPIYDRNMKVFAYEILYRSGQTGGAFITDGNLATGQVLLNTFLEIGFQQLTDSRPAFFNLTREFILDRTLELPKDLVVLEVLENIEIDAELVAAVERLAKAGYRIALDDFVFEERWAPLLRLADFIKVEVPAMDFATAGDQIKRLKGFKAKLLAEKVETHKEYEQCLALGFHLFQGYFFSKPNVVEGRGISQNRIGLLRMLAKVQEPDPNVAELDTLIRMDAGLSYKLLRYLNSPAIGLPNKIQSIRQAVTYLGLKSLKSWITLLAMAGVKDKPGELVKIGLLRGKICELVAGKIGHAADSERFFMTGLFSTLDALMDAPMEEILKQLPLTDDMTQALLTHSGPMGQALAAALLVERGAWEEANASLPKEVDLNEIGLHAIFWADKEMRAISA